MPVVGRMYKDATHVCTSCSKAELTKNSGADTLLLERSRLLSPGIPTTKEQSLQSDLRGCTTGDKMMAKS